MTRRSVFVGAAIAIAPLLLLFTLLQAVVAQGHQPTPSSDAVPRGALPTPVKSAGNPIESTTPNGLDHYKRTILLWPKPLSEFADEYPSWRLWLEGVRLTRYATRDELLISVQAIASQVPSLTVGTDAPDSNLIVVSGNVAAVWALMDRLRDHPLLARVTEDVQIYRDQARSAWVISASALLPEIAPRTDVPLINIHNSWVTNLVWGSGTPLARVAVTLTRGTGHTLMTTVQADADGLYHAYLRWDVRAGDIVEVDDGLRTQRVIVPTVRALTDRGQARVNGKVLPAAGLSDSLEVITIQTSRNVPVSEDGQFGADFRSQPFRPGDPGFVVYTDRQGFRIFQPFSVSVVRIRRDTSWGRPFGDTHSAGISSILWGSAAPEASLTITLTRPGQFVVTRTATADLVGGFSVSVDRLIEDGDVLEVSDGASVTQVPAVTLSYDVDGASKVIRGMAPAGITNLVPGAPHSLQVTIGGHSYPLTTTAEGEFEATLADNPYLAGLLGAMRYTTPEGDQVYKPLFVADPLERGKIGDWRADVILGQPDFSQITPDEVVDNRLFNPHGVYIDRSVQPNRVYVYDGGNSRVLGLSHLGACTGGDQAGNECTSDSDCPESTCEIEQTAPADIVLGQPSFNASACNGDSGYQLYPDVPMAGAETLCGLREEQGSISEGGSGATMVADDQGNFYVPDHFNNRVLRYNAPFSGGTVADYVWGQADFAGITCNRGAGMYQTADAGSLCLAPPPGYGDLRAGVGVDVAGNLWVADNENNRVLRFPYDPVRGVPAAEADLVLGQPDFRTITQGAGLDQMHKPNAVRVDTDGAVYVSDSLNHRVLVFEPPLSNGMPASWVLTTDVARPSGLELDPAGGIWVNDNDHDRYLHFVDGIVEHEINGVWSEGGLGLDRDSNLLEAAAITHQGQRHVPPEYNRDAPFLRADPWGVPNRTGAQGLQYGRGLEIAAGQLIYADRGRLLYWNDPWNLSNYQPADGFVGVPDFHTRTAPEFGRMRADQQGHLWVIYGGGGVWPVVRGYKLPVETGAVPLFELTSPLPLKGGGEFVWTESLNIGGIEVQPACDCVWLADRDFNRVFRVRNVTSQPMVDVVLGQLDITGTQCNQGRGRDLPSQDSLCSPGALALDPQGNLYVADHNLEVEGNWRLLEYDAASIPDAPASAVFGIPATRVFGRNGSFTAPYCLPGEIDPMCGPWEPTFDSSGRMVIGFNMYIGPKFPMVYQDPLTNPLPVAALGDLHSMPLSARFDQFDNLYILDHNRSRILIYRQRPVRTYAVTGQILTAGGDPIPGVQVGTTGYGAVATSDGSGAYSLTGLVTGTYELIPSKPHWTFVPISRTVSVPPNPMDQDFVGHYVSTTATLISPDEGDTVSEVVNIIVEGSGDWLELYLDGEQHGRARGPSATWSWNTREMGNGLHTLRTVPYDMEDRIGIPDSVTVTVNNVPSSVRWVLAGLEGEAVLDLAIAPANSLVLYAATASGRVYRSTDGGMLWVATSDGLPEGANLVSLAISPSSADVVYVGTAFSGHVGVFRSTDGGDSWHWMGPNGRVPDVTIAPGNDQFLYVAGDAAYRSLDGGMSWVPILSDMWTESAAVHPEDDQTAYLGGLKGSQWAVYKTGDGGSTWISRTLGSSWGILNLVIDPQDPQTVYAGARGGPGGVSKSVDGGLSWTRTGPGNDIHVESLAMAPSDSRVLYAGIGWGGVYQTTDAAVTWTGISDGLPSGIRVDALAVEPSDPAIVYAGLNPGGLWKMGSLAPSAAFSASPISGLAPLMVTFSNESSGNYVSSLWEFGDGLTSALPSPSHTYTAEGAYPVSLTVSGPIGSDIEVKPGYITVYGHGTLALAVDLQGRSDDSGATFTAWLDGQSAGSCTSESDGTCSILLPGGTFSVTSVMTSYLNSIWDDAIVTPGPTTTLPTVKLRGGDVNDDCTVNIHDLNSRDSRFGSRCGGLIWDTLSDINGDCALNILDLTMAGGNFSRSCPTPWTAVQQGGPEPHAMAQVTLEPSTLSMMPGQTGVLTITVAGAAGLYGAEAHMTFDPDVVTVMDTEAGKPGVQVALGDLLQPDFVAVNAVDNMTATIDIALTQLAPTLPAEGEGALAVITFQAVGTGTSSIPLMGVILADQDGMPIPAEVHGGAIYVGGEEEKIYLPLVMKAKGP